MKKTIISICVFMTLFYLFSKDKTEVFIQLGHASTITSVVMTKDNRYIISGSLDKTIKIWDVSNNTLIKTLSGHDLGIKKIAISPDDRYIVSGGRDKTVKLWDMEKE